jgi:hypothetical protein
MRPKNILEAHHSFALANLEEAKVGVVIRNGENLSRLLDELHMVPLVPLVRGERPTAVRVVALLLMKDGGKPLLLREDVELRQLLLLNSQLSPQLSNLGV